MNEKMLMFTKGEVDLMLNDLGEVPPVRSREIIMKLRDYVKQQVDIELSKQEDKEEKKEQKNG